MNPRSAGPAAMPPGVESREWRPIDGSVLGPRYRRRIGPIPFRIDGSWLFVVVLVIWSFWDRFTGGTPHHSVGAAFVMAAAASALFFGSILAHELAHALEASRRGVQVSGITLHLFGGVTEMTSEAARPRDAFVLTALGPYTSLVLGAAFSLVAFFAGRAGFAEVAEVTGVLGWLNVMLGLFNLLPGAPLDGGRLLQAVVWRVTGDRTRATVAAARAGQVLGTLLVAAGFWEMFFVLGGFIGGVWLTVIGWFVAQAATAEKAGAELERVLEGRPAGSLVTEPAEVVEPGTSLGRIVQVHFLRHHLDAVPVVEAGRLVGFVHIDDVRAVAPEQRGTTVAGEVMRPLGGVPRVGADQPALAAVAAAGRAGLVAVIDGRRLLALLSPRQLEAASERIRLLEGVRRGGPRR